MEPRDRIRKRLVSVFLRAGKLFRWYKSMESRLPKPMQRLSKRVVHLGPRTGQAEPEPFQSLAEGDEVARGKKKILMIAPDPGTEMGPWQALRKIPAINKRAFMAPLPLATVAGLTPDDYVIDIWDEPVRGLVDDDTPIENYDIVAVTGYTAHFPRVKAIAELARRRGAFLVVGGPGVSSSQKRYSKLFDVLFVGEAEHTWPQFLADFETGHYEKEYRQVIKPEMDVSQVPRWDSVAHDLKYYMVGAVQTTRGCPFDCEFCDVIFLYGRQPRHKDIDQVLEEITTLRKLGVTSIFFSDDNFIGNPAYAKRLLRALIPVNNSFESPITFSTQITLNCAKDDDLLALLADANFGTLFIGIETPNKESLRETNKPQNYKTDIVADVHKVLSYGLSIKAGMIVGFDHDDESIFDWQFDFVQEAKIPVPAIAPLKVPVGTKLWSRMLKERRVIAAGDEQTLPRVSGSMRVMTNLIPKQMSRIELMSGYGRLIERVDAWENFAERMKGFVSLVNREPRVARKRPAIAHGLTVLWQVMDAVEDDEARDAILDILAHTCDEAPHMLSKVMTLIVQHVGVAAMSIPMRIAVQKQIEMEETITDLDELVDRLPVLIPDGFETGYRKVFPKIYARVREGLDDESLLPEALIEVFADFLTRWGASFDGMNLQHEVNLEEIADRTLAAKNADGDGNGATSHPGEAAPDSKKLMLQLQTEVLKAVEQELRESYGPVPAASASDVSGGAERGASL